MKTNELMKLNLQEIRQNHNSNDVKLMAQAAEAFLEAYYNENYWDMDDNGEFYLLKTIKDHCNQENFTLFDVGANQGVWTLYAYKLFINSTIHSFEIIPDTFAKLEANTSKFKNIIVNNIGLSDSSKEVKVTYYPSEDTGSSINSLPWNSNSKTVVSYVTNGDSYALNKKVETIDILKIDTEGHDFCVLKGFSNFLQKAKIKVIQFEYGKTCIPPRITLGDFYNLLEPLGYSIGRLYPNQVKFQEYNLFRDEHFRMGNYVAVHRNYSDLIKLIS